VENIARHLQMGKRPIDAALEAADDIGLAVIATTFTLVAVFLPTAFMSGRIAEWRGESLELTGTEFSLIEVLARSAG
ncbi:efflux RND transporter permease subunit, partial [Rhizobium leguminosarum]|uniref:efflux RND transporter permease subunit n=1 Tax=Rhizobium leguminosarum TaxID=384 RepID=UPI003F959942